MDMNDCPECHGKRIVKEEDGTAHVCWECLKQGKLDVHTKNLKDSGIDI